MTDVLVYAKDFEAPAAAFPPLLWHSNATVFGNLVAGDRLWVVTSGKAINREPTSAAYLVAVWQVSEVVKNPDDDPSFPARKFAHRVVASDTDSVTFHDPVNVDNLIRPDDAEQETAAGIGLLPFAVLDLLGTNTPDHPRDGRPCTAADGAVYHAEVNFLVEVRQGQYRNIPSRSKINQRFQSLPDLCV